MLRIFSVVVLSVLAGWAAAPGEEELRQAEKDWAAAVQKNDLAELERVLGERLIYNHSTGVVEDKQQYLDRLRKGLQKYELIEQASMEVRAYGDTGVVSARVRMKGRSDQRLFDDRLIMLHVWVKRGGRWQLVAHQTTKLP